MALGRLMQGRYHKIGILTIEGVVDNRQIKLTSDVRLPEHTKVLVVVPDTVIEQSAHLYSPRLKNQNEEADFRTESIRKLPNERI